MTQAKTAQGQGRGELTSRVQEKAKELLGREISLRELRLMPYVANVMLNKREIGFAHVNEEEIGILESWDEAGWIHFSTGSGSLFIPQDFWIKLHEILWLSYVDLSEGGQK